MQLRILPAIKSLYAAIPDQWGRAIFWGGLLLGLVPGAMMAWLAAQLHWFWNTLGWFGVGAVLLLGWMVTGVALAAYESFMLQRERRAQLKGIAHVKDVAFSDGQKLSVHNVWPSSDKSAYFHHKIWVVLQNQSGSEIIIRHAAWLAASGDLETLPSTRLWSLKRGSKWNSPELIELIVPPMGVFRTYFAVNTEIACGDMTRRLLAKQLGTVVVSMTVNGLDMKDTIVLGCA